MVKPKVLALDDEAAVGRALKRVLNGAGFEVTAVQNLAAAMAALKESRFAVIISDERMPDISGVAFLESCAREFPWATRILLTGYADAETAAEAIQRAEIFRLLFKPWSETELVSAVREAAWRNALLDDEEVSDPRDPFPKDPEPN